MSVIYFAIVIDHRNWQSEDYCSLQECVRNGNIWSVFCMWMLCISAHPITVLQWTFWISVFFEPHGIGVGTVGKVLAVAMVYVVLQLCSSLWSEEFYLRIILQHVKREWFNSLTAVSRMHAERSCGLVSCIFEQVVWEANLVHYIVFRLLGSQNSIPLNG